jgi:hypothetical protein
MGGRRSGRPRTAPRQRDLADRLAPQRPGSLLPDWYSVVNDVALFLGDVMIERHPNLHWEFFTWGKKNASYQRPVIMGFGTEDPKFRTNLDVHRGVATYGHRIVAQRGSIPTYGTVTVRGAKLDIDATTEASHLREVDIDEFRRSLQIAARRA